MLEGYPVGIHVGYNVLLVYPSWDTCYELGVQRAAATVIHRPASRDGITNAVRSGWESNGLFVRHTVVGVGGGQSGALDGDCPGFPRRGCVCCSSELVKE